MTSEDLLDEPCVAGSVDARGLGERGMPPEPEQARRDAKAESHCQHGRAGAGTGSRWMPELYAKSTQQHGNGGHRWKRWTREWAPFLKLLETAPF